MTDADPVVGPPPGPDDAATPAGGTTPPAEPVDAPFDPPADLSVEGLLDDVERLAREREEFLDALRRSQADFDNYRKRMAKQGAEQAEHATGRLVEDLLAVLDACDGAMHHGAVEVEPIFAALLGVLEKNGLERIDPVDELFDPNRHDAVMHEPSEDGGETQVVDVMRRGYAWKGRVLRPAMVKVRG